MDYVILMDVSGDVDHAYAEKEGIGFIPMEYSLGEEMKKCTVPESRETLHVFYESQRKGNLTKTSQISPYLYEVYLRPYFDRGLSVLCLCLSGGLSSTYSSACLAKQSLEEQYPGQKLCVIDSLSASGGIGVLAERACRNHENGMSLEENAADITAAAHKIRHWFLVQDLMYLKRGGRISAATAVIATALNIKPILIINPEGKLDTIAKIRGNRQAADYIVEQFEKTYDGTAGDSIYIIDADEEEIGDYLFSKLSERYPNASIRRSGLSPIIGAHTGPGMAAICHMGK